MATVEASRQLEPPPTPIGWDGRTLRQMLEDSQRLLEETGRYQGLERLELMQSDPIRYEKIFSRVRGGLVSARETALSISASPIVREIGELCFALYTPEGDSVALSTGIIVHVHTMSDALKHMVRSDYERNPGIRARDIFANNNPVIGDVHNADVQTFVPIFWEDELIAWAGGVTHVLDIGASSAGGVPVGPTTRLDDGIDIPCMKIGERDELAPWHLKRCELMSRAPMYYLLDERTRLAGCHMIRDAVERIIHDEGIERFKQFSREVIEEGRRTFKAHIREMTVPGRYRAPAFTDVEWKDKLTLPPRARRDLMMHSSFEVRIGGDGDFALDYDGCSAWGYHSFNCTPSAMQGAIWVQFTQTLIPNDKVNDGAYLALDTNFPEGTWANIGGADCATGAAWAFLQPSFTGFPRVISRAVQSRGFIEEVLSSYSVSGNCLQGGGIDQYGNTSGIMNFEFGAQGLGAKYVADGTDFGAAMFNPEGDMGDVEAWEQISPFCYLARRLKASSAGAGRHRGGSSHESLFLVWNTPFYEVQNIGTGKVFGAPGLFGGYPGACAYIHTVRDSDVFDRARDGEAYPVCDGDYEDPALMRFQGDRVYKQDSLTPLEPVKPGDLYLSTMRGGGGLGDPLLRPVEEVERDVREGHLLERFAESVYALKDREAARRARRQRARPVREWWERERQRILDGALIEALRVMYAESMKLSPRWAAEFRGFWDLPEDFEFEADTPTVEIARSEPGKVTPEEAADEFLAGSKVSSGGDAPIGAASAVLEQRTLGDLLDERLDRRTVRAIQSGFKDQDRFDKWLAVLQERVSYNEPIVLPLGEGLNVVRRGADGEQVVRCDCGHDFCPPHRNWKMDAVVHVRESDEAMREVHPRMGHADPNWMVLREFYCPQCARQLEVEAVPPGYPVVHDFLPDIKGFYRGWLGREVA